jgi:hypothetical protein
LTLLSHLDCRAAEIFVVQPTEARPACLLDRRKVNENVLAGGSLSFPDQLSLPTEG